MKVIDRYLSAFVILFALYTIMFRYLLSYSLENAYYSSIWIYAAVYAVLIFVTAWNLGKFHSLKNFIFDAGLAFHLATYLTWGIISELWFVLNLNSAGESASTVHFTLLIWGIFLSGHIIAFLVQRKNTIRGVHKSDIFE
jgi:hypothetical protein